MPPLRTLRGHHYWVNAVTFSPGGKLVVGAGYRQVIFWDVATGEIRREIDR